MDQQARLERIDEGLANASDDIYSSVRELTHFASNLSFVPAPTLYRVLGENKTALWAYGDAIHYLSAALLRSLDQPGLTLTDSDFATGQVRNPADSVRAATTNLERVEALLREAGQLLEAAQTSINGQGFELEENPT